MEVGAHGSCKSHKCRLETRNQSETECSPHPSLLYSWELLKHLSSTENQLTGETITGEFPKQSRFPNSQGTALSDLGRRVQEGQRNQQQCNQSFQCLSFVLIIFCVCVSLLRYKWKWKSLSHVWLFVAPWTHIVHGILQARILEWAAFPFSRGSSQPSDRTQVSHTAGRFFKGNPRIVEWVAYPFSSGIFQTQESNRGLLHCRQILYQLSYEGSPQNIAPIQSTHIDPW